MVDVMTAMVTGEDMIEATTGTDAMTTVMEDDEATAAATETGTGTVVVAMETGTGTAVVAMETGTGTDTAHRGINMAAEGEYGKTAWSSLVCAAVGWRHLFMGKLWACTRGMIHNKTHPLTQVVPGPV